MIAFANSFLSYLVVFLVFVAVIALAVAIGITLRKGSNAKAAALQAQETAEEGADEPK